MKATLILGLALMLAACGGRPDIPTERLFGTYVANHGLGDETLVVGSNGTYRHSFASQNRRFVENGSWKTVQNGRLCRGMEFANFRFGILTGLRPDAMRGDWFVCPELYPDGSIVLLYDPDRDLYYRK